MDRERRTPTVFISSTCFDLSQIREDLKDFFQDNYGMETLLSEFNSFPIDPCVGTFENCLNNVDKRADMLVLIVGDRYGYVLESGKSITNLEYLHAKEKGIPVFVFVSNKLYNTLPVWKANKAGDYSSIVDNTQIFEFVSGIYDEQSQWIYTYNTVREIKQALKEQMKMILFDGLYLNTAIKNQRVNGLIDKLSAKATRIYIEKPSAWEYKFFAQVLKDEFDKLQERRWDYEYGLYDWCVNSFDTMELVEDLSKKFKEMDRMVGACNVLINIVLKKAINEEGEPSDLDMFIYIAKHLAKVYEKMISWALYFKAVYADEEFQFLLTLLYELPKYITDKLDIFVTETYTSIMSIPDIEDGEERLITVSCVLDEANFEAINTELSRLNNMYGITAE